MKTYTLPDGRTLSEGEAFTLNGIQYPRSWLSRATPEWLQETGITVTEPEPPAPVPPTQTDLLNYLADLRWAAESAGVDFQGVILPTDREKRSALKDAADKLRDGTLTAPIAIAFSATVYANVTLEQLDAAVGAITVYVQEVFSDAAAVAAQIIAGTITTIAQVDAAWNAQRAS